MLKPLARIFTVAVCLAIASCSGEDSDPENLLRQTINQIQDAAEKRQISSLMELVDNNYADPNGYNKKQIRALAQFQFVRNPKIYSLKQIKSIAIHDDRRASATVVVALAGKPIDSPGALAGLRADLYRFDLEFIFDQDWKVTNANWQPAKASDFL